MAIDHAWLDQVREEALEPEIAICDPHHHFWDRPDYGQYFLPELVADISGGHRVLSTVFLECRSMYRRDGPPAFAPVGETEFVRGQAAMSASWGYGTTRVAAAIVGHADLSLGYDVAPVLEAHLAAAPGRFRGIRRGTAFDESIEPPAFAARAAAEAGEGNRSPWTTPPGMMADGAFRKGFSQLARYGLSFDAWVYHPQLGELADLAKAFPDTRFILNHAGGPLGVGRFARKQDEVKAAWRAGTDALAALPNVVVKLGGVNMPINGHGWHKRERPPTSAELAEPMREYILHAIDQFGPGRCMFESNFPVEKNSCSYTVLWNAFKRLVADFRPDEKAQLFHDTAAAVYRL